jgi:hypothetical protein
LQKRWTIEKANAERVTQLQQDLKIHSAICKILVQRGIDTFQKAKRFFRPQLTELHDPKLLKESSALFIKKKKFLYLEIMMWMVQPVLQVCISSSI